MALFTPFKRLRENTFLNFNVKLSNSDNLVFVAGAF